MTILTALTLWSQPLRCESLKVNTFRTVLSLGKIILEVLHTTEPRRRDVLVGFARLRRPEVPMFCRVFSLEVTRFYEYFFISVSAKNKKIKIFVPSRTPDEFPTKFSRPFARPGGRKKKKRKISGERIWFRGEQIAIYRPRLWLLYSVRSPNSDFTRIITCQLWLGFFFCHHSLTIDRELYIKCSVFRNAFQTFRSLIQSNAHCLRHSRNTHFFGFY